MDDENIAHRINLSTGPDSSNFETQGSTIKSASNDDRIGELIAGKYKIIEKLGQGGMGTVYKVEQVLLSKICALKLISSNVSSIHLRRFQIEAKAAAQLEHANTIKTLDFGMTDDGVAYIVMEYADGITLSDHLRKHGPLSIEDTLGIFIPLCHALDEAHSKGIVHRDIKPSNILLVKKDNALVGKLADFGVARLTASDEVNALTRTGEIIGSPLYMSPEQCSAQPVDSRSDIYSFGCTLFESLTGAPPFTGASMLETMTKHVNEKPPTLQQASLLKEFPEELEALVAMLLEKHKEDRHQSMFQVATHLTAIQNGTAFETSAFGHPSKSKRSPPSDKSLLVCGVIATLVIAGVVLGTVSSFNNDYRPSQSSSNAKPAMLSPVPDRSQPTSYYSTIQNVGTKSEVRTFQFGPRKIGELSLWNEPIKGFGIRVVQWPQKSKAPDAEQPETLRFIPTDEFVVMTPQNFGRFREDEIFALNFPRDCQITADAAHYIAKLKSLTQFNAHGTDITDEAFLSLRALTKLSTIDIRHTDVTGIGLADLKPMKSLTYLRTSELTHLKECLDWLSLCPKLTKLEIMNCAEMKNQDLKAIAKLEQLTHLDISGCVNVSNLAGIKSLRQLQSLNIASTSVSKEAVRDLAALPALKTLTLDGNTFATSEDQAKVRETLPLVSDISFARKENAALYELPPR